MTRQEIEALLKLLAEWEREELDVVDAGAVGGRAGLATALTRFRLSIGAFSH